MTDSLRINHLPIQGYWTLHSYYTLSPYAPDGSGRILAAAADLRRGTGSVLVLGPEGQMLDRFGEHRLETGFYHTGWWQTWSPDSRYVYYQAGSMADPKIGRRDLATGCDIVIPGDMEGAPPTGEPILSGLMGMLYAAGYGDGVYKPAQAPVPFQQRDRHGIFEYRFEPHSEALRLSVSDLLEAHPYRDRITASDAEVRARLGSDEGLTLMAYCLRWNADASRFLFYFGNHCVVKARAEPKLAYVMTADRNFQNIHLAVDLSYGKPGLHWSWQPDGETLIGYGPDPAEPARMCLAEVRYDGTGYRKLSDHASGGHPSVSPADRNLIVTDEGTSTGGAVVFISRETGRETRRIALPKFVGAREPEGRNALRVCHHPVFSPDGRRLLCNTLPGENAVLAEISLM